MHAPERSQAQARADGPSSDSLDRLLLGYYRHEMPEPWPAAPSRLRSQGRGMGPRWAVGSRLALAATLALVALGTICLADLSHVRLAKPATNEQSDPYLHGANTRGNDNIIREEIIKEGDDTVLKVTVEPSRE